MTNKKTEKTNNDTLWCFYFIFSTWNFIDIVIMNYMKFLLLFPN